MAYIKLKPNTYEFAFLLLSGYTHAIFLGFFAVVDLFGEEYSKLWQLVIRSATLERKCIIERRGTRGAMITISWNFVFWNLQILWMNEEKKWLIFMLYISHNEINFRILLTKQFKNMQKFSYYHNFMACDCDSRNGCERFLPFFVTWFSVGKLLFFLV